MSEVRDLDTLISAAKQKEAQRSSSEAAQVAAIRILSNAGGALPVRDLISRYGVASNTIAALCDEEQHTDKRRKVRARLGEVDGEPIVWLTASGHQAAGKTRGVEIRPTSDSLHHALAPSKLAAWLEGLSPSLSPRGIELSVTWGPACQTFSRSCEALAWARLKTHADPSGALGLLTGGLIPDALLIERRTIDAAGAAEFQVAWGDPPRNLDELAETTIAVEVQNATRQAGDPLRSKVDAWSAVLNNFSLATKVLWIVEPAAHKVLVSLGVGDPSRREGQILVAASELGLNDKHFNAFGPRWWALDVPRGAGLRGA
jgi:hypothetical protein